MSYKESALLNCKTLFLRADEGRITTHKHGIG